ncbi:MAG: hypothetical protein ACRC7W_01665, partial [Fusobacteriaceae bacterium]
KILTSKRIQETFLTSTTRRKKVELMQHLTLLKDINVYINLVIVDINGVNVDISTQSKVKRKKIEKEKENKQKVNENYDVLHSYLKFISETYEVPLQVVEKDCKKHGLHKGYNDILLTNAIKEIKNNDELRNKDTKFYAMFLKVDELEKIVNGLYNPKKIKSKEEIAMENTKKAMEKFMEGRND